MTIPYTLTLDYDNDEKTARIGSSTDDAYPYDYRAWTGLTVTGDVSGNSVTATGTIEIVAGQQTNSFSITINDDAIYEFDETITLSIGAVGVDLTNANKASSNTELMITVTNAGELAPVLTLSRALQPDNASLISGSSVTASSYLETVTSDDETTNNPYFEAKIVDPSSGADTEAGMDLKFSYSTSGTSSYLSLIHI